MKRAILVLVGVAGILGLCGCDEEMPEVAPTMSPQRAASEYPVEMTLEDNKGRKLEATIIGRTASEVIFTLAGSRKEHRYQITNLSLSDQGAVLKLPVYDSPKDTSLERDELARIEIQITEAQAEMQKTPNANMRNRAYEQKIEKLKEKRKEIKAKMRAR